MRNLVVILLILLGFSLNAQTLKDSVKTRTISDLPAAQVEASDLFSFAKDSSGVRIWKAGTADSLKNYINTFIGSFNVDGSPDTVTLYVHNGYDIVIDSLVIPLTASGGSGSLTQEQVEDFVGGMLSGNTETGITVTYEDSDGTIDFVVNVTTSEITDGTILAADFSTGAVTSTAILDGTISASDLGSNSVDSDELVDGGIDYSHLSAAVKDSINYDLYIDSFMVDGSPDTITFYINNRLTNTVFDSIVVPLTASGGGGGFTQEEIEDFVGAMTTGNTETLITVTYQDVDGTLDFVVDNDLANYSNATSGFLTSNQTITISGDATGSGTTSITLSLAANSVGNAEIATNAVSADELAANSVGASEIQTGAVGTDEIDNGSIAWVDLSSPVQDSIQLARGTGTLADGDKGDITVASSGTVWTIDNDAVDAAAIATDAVGIDEIAANSVGSSELLSTAVTPGSYTNTNLTVDADGRITAASNGTDNVLTQEQVEDYAGGMWTGNTETLITVTYQDADGTIDAVVNDDLSLYDNTTSGFITGNETITLSGDVTGSGTTAITTTIAAGAVGTTELADDAVTVAKIAQNGATTGQVLKWNGTDWAAANDSLGVGGSGITSLGGQTGSTQTFSSNDNTVDITSSANNHDFQIGDVLPRMNTQPGGGVNEIDFADFFDTDCDVVLYDTAYQWETYGTKGIIVSGADNTADTFNINWKTFPELPDPYTLKYNDSNPITKWHFQIGFGTHLGRIDSITYRDNGDNTFHYTMINGTEPVNGDSITIYNPFIQSRNMNDSIEYVNLGFDIDGTFDSRTVDYYQNGGSWRAKDGRLMSLVMVEFTTGQREVYSIQSRNDGKNWELVNGDTEFIDLADFSWAGGTVNRIIPSDAYVSLDTPYINHIIITGWVQTTTEERDWYMVINDNWEVITGPTEINYSGYLTTDKHRSLGLEKHRNKFHQLTINRESADASLGTDDATLHFVYNTLTDFFNGNFASVDTFYLGAAQSGTLQNAICDDATMISYGDKLACIYTSKDDTNNTYAIYSNRSLYVTYLDETVDTFPLAFEAPKLIVGFDYGYYSDGTGDWMSDHYGGSTDGFVHNNVLHLISSYKGEDQLDDYYRMSFLKIWNKEFIKSEDIGLGEVTTREILDATIKEEDLTGSLQTKVNLQGTKQAFTPTTAVSWDLDSKISGAAHIDCTSVSSGVTLTVSNPNATYPSYYTLYFYNVAGTDAITFPAGWIGEDGTALGTVNLTADKYYACEYINIDASNLYLCK